MYAYAAGSNVTDGPTDLDKCAAFPTPERAWRHLYQQRRDAIMRAGLADACEPEAGCRWAVGAEVVDGVSDDLYGLWTEGALSGEVAGPTPGSHGAGDPGVTYWVMPLPMPDECSAACPGARSVYTSACAIHG